MALQMNDLPSRVNQTWKIVRQLNKQERLMLAKALLDSIVMPTLDEESNWQNLSLTAFAADWDNPDDAIYDNWREHYDV